MANSRLIAAAPELLAELRDAATSLEAAAETFEQLGRPGTAGHYSKRAAEVRATIAKATGQQ